MSSRKSSSGPASALNGFITVGETAVAPSTTETLVTAVAQVQIPPSGASVGNMNAKLMSTRDIVSVTPRVTPISSTAAVPIRVNWAKVLSVDPNQAIIQLALQPTISGVPATAAPNTYDIDVTLRSGDL